MLDDVRYTFARFTLDLCCVISAEIAPSDVAKALGALAARYYTGTLVTQDAIANISRVNEPGVISAWGIGSPPSGTVGIAALPWADDCLIATGQAATDGAAEAQRDALERARFDALHRLAIAMDRLEVAPGFSVRSVLLAHPD